MALLFVPIGSGGGGGGAASLGDVTGELLCGPSQSRLTWSTDEKYSPNMRMLLVSELALLFWAGVCTSSRTCPIFMASEFSSGAAFLRENCET